MELRDLETGTRLELEPVGREDDNNSTIYVSRLEWLEGENTAVIDAPINKGNVIPLEPDSLFDVYFLSRKRKMINLFKFRAVVKGRLIIDNLHVLVIVKNSDIVRVQRRSYFRLDCFMEVRYRLLGAFNSRNNDDIPFRTTMANDLSGGGIRLLLDEKLDPGTLVECELFGEQTRAVKFRGVVVRYDDTDNGGQYKYTAGIAYIDIEDADREAVIRYIFREQRRLLSKGLD